MQRITQRSTIDPYVIDVLMPDLVGHDRRPAAFIVYLFLLRHARAARVAAVDEVGTTASDGGSTRPPDGAPVARTGAEDDHGGRGYEPLQPGLEKPGDERDVELRPRARVAAAR